MAKHPPDINQYADDHTAGGERPGQAAGPEYKKRCERVFREAPVMLLSIDLQGGLNDVSDRWLKTLGYERGEVLGRPFSDFLTGDSRGADESVATPLFFAKGSIRDFPYQLVARDGRILDVLLSAVADYDESGNIARKLCVIQDISPLKSAEKRLRESEERWRFALEGSRSGVWDWRVRDDIFYVSKRWEQLLGFEAGGSPGEGLEKWSSRLHPDDKNRVLAAIMGHAEGESPHYEEEYRLRGKDGVYRWFLDRGKVLSRDSENRPYRYIGAITNIDVLKRAEDALRRSEASLAQAQRLANIGYWEWDVRNDRINCSDAIYGILGLDPESFTPNYENFVGRVHPGDRERLEEGIDQALREGAYDIEHRIVRPDGSVRHIHWIGETDYGPGGRPARLFGMAQDVTEYKLWQEIISASESKLRAMSEASHDALVMIDSSDRILFWSPAAERMFGYAAEEVQGQKLHPLLALPEDEARSRAGVKKFAETGDGPVMGAVLEFTARRKDGSEFPIECSAASFKMGSEWYAVGSMRDITKRKQAEERQRKTMKILEEKQARIDEDLSAAAAIQRSLLPQRAPMRAAYEIDWRFEPSQTIGGDIFDFIKLDADRLGVYMLDVSGHGVPSALIAVSASRALAPTAGIVRGGRFGRIVPPDKVMKRLNVEFPFERFEKYFTMVYFILGRDGCLSYSVAGHPPPIIVRSGGEVELLEKGGFFIGLETGADYEMGETMLDAGDLLVLYTDGLTEYSNANGKLYGDERFHDRLVEHRGERVDDIVQAVVEDLKDFGGGVAQTDDVSLICFKKIGARRP